MRRRNLAAGPPLQPAQNLHIAAKPCILASWRPRRPPDGPAGGPDGLLPLAPEGLRTVLLAPKTISGRASWRPRRPPDGPLGAKRAFDAYAFLSILPRLHDDFLDETSARSTRLQMNFAACRLASSIYIDGVTLVLYYLRSSPPAPPGGALRAWSSGLGLG